MRTQYPSNLIFVVLQRLAQRIRGADLLIHEATFTTEHQDHALSKRHSTLEEAVALAEQCGVRRLICTHFSQR